MFVTRAAAYFIVLTENLAAADYRILVESLAPTPHSPVTLSSQYVDYGNAGWCYGGSDVYVGKSQNAAACWSMCVSSIDVKDLIAIDWWPYGYAGGQYRTCFCQMACTCLAEVGAGNTLLVATSFAELNGLPATCKSMNENSGTPSPTPITGKDAIVNRRILIICGGLVTVIVCACLITKSPVQNSQSGDALRAANEAVRVAEAAEAQEAAQALALRLEAVPAVKFSRVLDVAADPKAVDTTCAICLVDMESADFVRQLSTCHHCYHVDCLDEWLRVSELCPLCKTSVLPPSDNIPTAVATTAPRQSDGNSEYPLTIIDMEGTEAGSLPLSDDAPLPLPSLISSPSSPSTSQPSSPERNLNSVASPPPPLRSNSAQLLRTPGHRPRRLSRDQRGTSLDDTLEMVPVSSQPSPSLLPHSPPRSSSSSPRQVHPLTIPIERERGRAWSGRVAPSEYPAVESLQSTPRRQPPSRTTRQPHQRAVPITLA